MGLMTKIAKPTLIITATISIRRGSFLIFLAISLDKFKDSDNTLAFFLCSAIGFLPCLWRWWWSLSSGHLRCILLLLHQREVFLVVVLEDSSSLLQKLDGCCVIGIIRLPLSILFFSDLFGVLQFLLKILHTLFLLSNFLHDFLDLALQLLNVITQFIDLARIIGCLLRVLFAVAFAVTLVIRIILVFIFQCLDHLVDGSQHFRELATGSQRNASCQSTEPQVSCCACSITDRRRSTHSGGCSSGINDLQERD